MEEALKGSVGRRERRLLRHCIKKFAPPPDIQVSEWADLYRIISAEAASAPGRWYTSRAEYQREIMDAASNPEIDQVVVVASAQVGKTEFLLNCIAYFIDCQPCPMMVLQPTLEMAAAFSNDRLAPMIRDTKKLHEAGFTGAARANGNKILHKAFLGGQITMAGANSPSSLASRPIRIVFLDEVDRYPFSAGAEGDPVALVWKRATTFFNKKLFMVSTPTLTGFSRIVKEFEKSDKRYFHVPCPHCDETQVLKWANVQWPKDEPGKAYYVCEHCACIIENKQKASMVAKGKWIATRPLERIAGFHISELYSPWRAWGETAKEFIKAKADGKEALQVWTNTALGETWDPQPGDAYAWEKLMARIEPYQPMIVPEKALVLTAGVDVQNDRLAVKIKGWGEGEESWVIYHTEIYGDPGGDKLWEELDELLTREFDHASGAKLSITATAIDSGGHHTQRVYVYAFDRAHRNVIAIKGSSTPGMSIHGKKTAVEIDHKGRKVNNATLWLIGTDTAKGLIYSRFALTSGAVMHFYAGLTEEYFRQLTAEKRVSRMHKGQIKTEWLKDRPRNEALDCEVYALFAAYHAGIQRINWEKLRKKLLPETSQKKSDTLNVPEFDGSDIVAPVQESQKAKKSLRVGGMSQKMGGWMSGSKRF